jgi:hypothetical protein
MFALSVAAQMTLGLVGVVFVFFPLLGNVIVVFSAAQVLGERQENLDYERAHTY